MMVNCDECNKDFEVNTKIYKVNDDIEKTYFVCTNCRHEYIAFYTNSSIRKKQVKINNIANIFNKSKNLNAINKLNNQFMKLKKEIKKEMKNLRNELEKKNV
ncbi:MAG: transglycosylase [Romboutsia sp.]